MSWSLSASGKKEQAASRVQEQAAAITFLTGTEAELKDQAVALALTTIEACSADTSISVSMYGSASFKDGEQIKQSISVSVTTS